MVSKIIPAVIFSCIIYQSALAQADSSQSLQYLNTSPTIPNSIGVTFDNNINTYRWDGNIIYRKYFNNLDVQLNEQYKSSLIQTAKKLIRDEQNVELLAHYKISPSLRASSRVNSLTLSDNQSESLGKVTSHSLYGGLEYKLTNEITLEPLIGMRFDKQMNQEDRGFSYLLNAKGDNLEMSSFKTFFLGYFEGNYLSPRKLETHNLTLSIKKDFFQNTRNVVNISYKKNLREFYFTADPKIQSQHNVLNNIERRNENLISAFDTLDYNAGNGWQISLNGTASFRNIDRSIRYKPTVVSGFDSRYFDNNIHDFKIEGSTQLIYEPSKDFNSQIQMVYGERDVSHSLLENINVSTILFANKKRDEEKKNNTSRRTTLSGIMNIALSNNHKISLSGSGNILRYDTPSNLNDDDRDELWMVYNLTTYHTINQYFSVQIPVNAYLTHIVYLLKTRSANNNWNRIFRIAPRLQYIPYKTFSTTNTFEVLANYTAYDFEDQLTAVKSFSFRQFSFIDSSSLNITKRIAFDWYNYIRLYERGELNWKAFKGRPIDYFEDKTYIGQMRYLPRQNLLFSIGIRYFSQSSFKYEGKSKRLETFLRSIGPITSVVWNLNSSAELIIKGFYEKIEFTGTKTHSSTNLFMNIKMFL
jgi:hypothetical protein